jgi:hypothetical protein
MGDCRLKAKRLGGPKRLNRVLDARLAAMLPAATVCAVGRHDRVAFHGVSAMVIGDVGVAVLWRLFDRLDEIASWRVAIVVGSSVQRSCRPSIGMNKSEFHFERPLFRRLRAKKQPPIGVGSVRVVE